MVSGSDDARCGSGTWPPATRSATPFTGHTGWVTAVAVGELDGRPVVVSGSEDETVRVWDLATGSPVGDPFTGHTGWVRAVAVARAATGARWWSPAAATTTVRVWDLATGQPGRRPAHRPHRRGWTRWPSASWTAPGAWSPAATTRRCGCGTWPPASRSATRSPATPAGCSAVAVGELDGRPVVVSGSADATVRVWDLATGNPVGDPFTGHTGAVMAVAVGELDGRPVVVSGSEDRTVRVWDLATGDPVGDPFTGHTDSVLAVAVARAGRAPGGGQRRRRPTVRVWDLATGGPVGDPFTGHTGWVLAVAVGGAATAARWWSAAASDGTVRVWDLATGDPVGDPFTGHTGGCARWRSASWTAARWWSAAATDATVRVWDLATGSPVGDPFTGHTDWVAVAVAELDGRPVVVSGSATGRCGCGTWPPATRSVTRSPATPAGCVAVAVAELDGRPVVVSGGNDSTVQVWELAHNTLLQIALDAPVTAVASTGEMHLVVATTRVWLSSTYRLAAQM